MQHGNFPVHPLHLQQLSVHILAVESRALTPSFFFFITFQIVLVANQIFLAVSPRRNALLPVSRIIERGRGRLSPTRHLMLYKGQRH